MPSYTAAAHTKLASYDNENRDLSTPRTTEGEEGNTTTDIVRRPHLIGGQNVCNQAVDESSTTPITHR